MLDGFLGLRHDAVVGGDDDDGDVRQVGAARAHGGERLVAGGVEEGDQAALVFDLVGADVLRDAAVFARGDVRLADVVQQGGFAVVDVAHEGDDGRAGLQVVLGVFGRAFGFGFRLDGRGRRRGFFLVFEHETELLGDLLGRLEVDLHGDGGEDALLHELGDQHVGLDAEQFGEFLDDDVAFDGDDLGFRGRGGRRFGGGRGFGFGGGSRSGGFFRRGGGFGRRGGGGGRRGRGCAAVVDALDFVAQILFQVGRQIRLRAARGAAAGLEQREQLLARGHQFLG